jgi:hypothetical protein
MLSVYRSKVLLTGVAVAPYVRAGFISPPFDRVPLAVIIPLIMLIFACVYSGGGRSKGTAHRPGRREHI